MRRAAIFSTVIGLLACSGNDPSGPDIIEPKTASIVLDFCSQNTPSFFAYKNDTAAWTRVMPDANGSFSFVSASKVAITFVRGSQVETYYTTSEELKAVSGLECKTDGTKTLSGSLANLGPSTPAGDPAFAVVTAGTARVTGTGAFTLNAAPEGRFDLVGVSYAYANQAIPPTKAIIRRDLLLSSGSTLPVLDFGSNEAVPISTHSLTVTGSVSSDFYYIVVDFTTANGTNQNWRDALAARGPLAFHAIPASLLANGDLHKIAFQSSAADFRSFRGTDLYLRDPSDKTIALGAPLNQPTVTQVATIPYVRYRGTVASQAEYGSAVQFRFSEALSGESGGDREWRVTGTAGYFGGTPATWELEVPDLSAVPGFSSSYGSKGIDFVVPQATAFNSLIGLFIGRAPKDGDVVKYSGIQSPNIPVESPPPPSPQSVELSIDSATLFVDDSLLAVATVTYSDGSIGTGQVQYSTSNQAVATVSSAGRIRATGIGTATITARAGSLSDALKVTVAPEFLELALGEAHTCGITGKHELFCWGSNSNGQLGVDVASGCPAGMDCSALPTRVTGGDRFVSVTVGAVHTCALTASGDAYCWGGNLNGALGISSLVTRNPTPTQVTGNIKFTSLAAGRFHTCGITTQGDTYCWGWDHWGQLGGGVTATDRCNFPYANAPCSLAPVRVATSQSLSKLWGSEKATCGQTAANTMYCWGLEVGGSEQTDCQFGQLARCTRTPLLQVEGAAFPTVGMGEIMRCGQSSGGRIECWGTDRNYFGNGTNPPLTTITSTPIVAAGGHIFKPATMEVGRLHMCAIDAQSSTSGDLVFCWGDGSQGQVGGAVGASRTSPGLAFTMPTNNGRIVLGTFSDTSCALDANGRAYCWGDGRFGQLGNGEVISRAEAVQVKLIR